MGGQMGRVSVSVVKVIEIRLSGVLLLERTLL